MSRALTILRLAPAGFVAAIGLLSALGLAGAWAIAQNATTLSVILWMLPSVVVGALFTVYGTALLQGSLAGSTLDIDRNVLWRQGRILIAVFAIFTVTISVAGFLYVSDLRTTVRGGRFDEQAAIANLKAQFIQKWLVDRSLDLQQQARSIANLVPADGTITRDTRGLIEVVFAELLAELPEQVGARLFAADGRLMINAGEPVEPDEGGLIVARALKQDKPYVQQRHLPATGALRLDFINPIRPSPGAPIKAVFVVTIDPSVSLLPSVSRWPTDSPTSEIVLLHRQGDKVVSVVLPAHAPRDRKDPISFDVSQSKYLGVQAVLMGDGVREALDYRNVPVLAASRHIESLDWHVVAKTDVAEALTPIDRRASLVIWLTMGAIIVAAATSVGLWHADRTSFRLLSARHEQERLALTRHYEQMIRHARDIVLLVDEEERIVEANAAALAAYGYSLQELRRMHVVDLRSGSEKAALAADWLTLHSAGRPVETVHRRKDGSEFPVEISGSSFDADHRRYFQAFIRDISERKRLEAELARLARVQAALQFAASLLLHAENESTLYQGMCDVLIRIGGYRLADVALARHDAAKSVEFAAIAGHDQDYLAQASITWGDGPRSKGPTGGAIRTGEVQINQDFESNLAMAPWRDEALKRGLRSSIGLPLRAGDTVIGALTIYSEQPFAFNADEVQFLQQFAADVSYGITLLRNRAA